MEDHRTGGWHAQAAEFPSIHRIGSGGCDACPGADRDIRGRTGQRCNERRHIDPGLFPRLASPGLSLVRAAGIWSQPGDEQVALAAAARRRFGLGGPSPPSSGRGRRERLRPAGRRLYQSDLAAMGGRGREEVRRNVDRGITYENPSNQCWPMPMPFIYKQFVVQIIQQPDRVLLTYTAPSTDVRRVRLNGQHPSPLTPSWYGDSVGHYEGDTLVIDTVGVKTDRPYAMIDLFGTPYTDKLHIVERYRLRDYDDVKDAIERNIKENWLFNGDVFSQHRGKFLQLHVTVEDEGVFTTPWSATLTYVPGPDQIPETVCAENPHEYYNNKDSDVPKADKPDF